MSLSLHYLLLFSLHCLLLFFITLCAPLSHYTVCYSFSLHCLLLFSLHYLLFSLHCPLLFSLHYLLLFSLNCPPLFSLPCQLVFPLHCPPLFSLHCLLLLLFGCLLGFWGVLRLMWICITRKYIITDSLLQPIHFNGNYSGNKWCHSNEVSPYYRKNYSDIRNLINHEIRYISHATIESLIRKMMKTTLKFIYLIWLNYILCRNWYFVIIYLIQCFCQTENVCDLTLKSHWKVTEDYDLLHDDVMSVILMGHVTAIYVVLSFFLSFFHGNYVYFKKETIDDMPYELGHIFYQFACAPMRAGWSESSLSAWRRFRSLAIQKLIWEDSDHTGRMHRLNWIFFECTWNIVGSAVGRLISSIAGRKENKKKEVIILEPHARSVLNQTDYTDATLQSKICSMLRCLIRTFVFRLASLFTMPRTRVSFLHVLIHIW